jgi:hypothetical protein
MRFSRIHFVALMQVTVNGSFDFGVGGEFDWEVDVTVFALSAWEAKLNFESLIYVGVTLSGDCSARKHLCYLSLASMINALDWITKTATIRRQMRRHEIVIFQMKLTFITHAACDSCPL